MSHWWLVVHDLACTGSCATRQAPPTPLELIDASPGFGGRISKAPLKTRGALFVTCSAFTVNSTPGALLALLGLVGPLPALAVIPAIAASAADGTIHLLFIAASSSSIGSRV